MSPRFAAAFSNLGTALSNAGDMDQAITCFRRALELQPNYPQAHSNLGNVLSNQGKLDEAVICYRRAVDLQPNYVGAHSNLVYTLNFSSNYDSKMIFEEHVRWNEQHALPLATSRHTHANDRSVERRLRIGYVSPDFRSHPVGCFILPLLESNTN